MDIRLKRDELLAELVPMQGIVERRTTIPVLSHLLLDARGGRLHVAATDLDVSLTSSVAARRASGSTACPPRTSPPCRRSRPRAGPSSRSPPSVG
jgi:DNA polymerase-3 subunit beta